VRPPCLVDEPARREPGQPPALVSGELADEPQRGQQLIIVLGAEGQSCAARICRPSADGDSAPKARTTPSPASPSHFNTPSCSAVPSWFAALVMVAELAAELLGHARLETTRLYTQPTAEDRAKAIDLLVVDE